MPGRMDRLPADLAEAAAGIDAIRRRLRGRRLPRRVWEVAEGLAACYGIEATARALGLDAGGLARRLGRPPRPRRLGPGAGGAFVEIVPTASASSEACVVEVEGVGGVRVRVRLAVADADLVERLVRALVRAPA